MTDTDLRPELRWLSSGFLLTFCSSFGQTYFIAIFAGHLKAALAISDGHQTGIFFNQVTIVEAKGWQLSWFAASFPVLAAVAVLSGLMTGWLIDRLGAHRLLALHLLPLGVSTCCSPMPRRPTSCRCSWRSRG